MMMRRALASLLLLLSATASAGADQEPYQVEFEISVSKGVPGKFVVEVYPEWAPLGAARFAEIIEAEIWKAARFFRVVHLWRW